MGRVAQTLHLPLPAGEPVRAVGRGSDPHSGSFAHRHRCARWKTRRAGRDHRRCRNAHRQTAPLPRAGIAGCVVCAGAIGSHVFIFVEVDMNDVLFAQLSNLGSSLMLLLGIALLWRRSLRASVSAFQWQSAALTAMFLIVGYFGHDPELRYVADVLFALKVIIIPRYLM